MFKSLFKENLEREKLNVGDELIETVLDLSEGNEEGVKSSEFRMKEADKRSDGLILKELLKHLKFAFLGEEKSKPVIIASDLKKRRRW